MPPHGPQLLVGHLVDPLVPNGEETEGHAAATAVVGLFPGVHDVVLDQVGVVVEGPILGARIWVHPSVYVLVQRELGALAEGLTALGVGVWPFVRTCWPKARLHFGQVKWFLSGVYRLVVQRERRVIAVLALPWLLDTPGLCVLPLWALSWDSTPPGPAGHLGHCRAWSDSQYATEVTTLPGTVFGSSFSRASSHNCWSLN